MGCNFNSATMEAEFRSGVDSTAVGGNSPSIGGYPSMECDHL